MLNKVILIGRLATDPELRYIPSGVAVTSFRLAVEQSVPNAQGVRDTDFLDIVAWKHSAEFCANYLLTGRLVSIDGRLRVRKWVAQDNTKRRTVEIHVNDIRALDKAPGTASHDMDHTTNGPDEPHITADALPVERTSSRKSNKPVPATAGATTVNVGPEDVNFNDPFADE